MNKLLTILLLLIVNIGCAQKYYVQSYFGGEPIVTEYYIALNSVDADNGVVGNYLGADGNGSLIYNVWYLYGSNPDPQFGQTNTTAVTPGSPIYLYIKPVSVYNIQVFTSDVPWYFRAAVINYKDTTYSDVLEIMVSPTATPVLPTVTTNSITAIAETTATGGGTVTTNGGAAVTARGVCWNTTGNPTTANSTTSDSTGIGSFASSLTLLSSSTTYYVKAYATNSVGTAYGSEVSFYTCGVPAVTTDIPTNITATSATVGGNVYEDGCSSVLTRGTVWNTTGSPTLADNEFYQGFGTGTYTGTVESLPSNTLIYVRAYASSESGTGYGVERSFTTDVATSVAYISHSYSTGLTSNPIIKTVTTTSGTNLLVIAVCVVTGTRETGTPTFNGASFTQIGSYAGTDPVELWYLINPSIGTYDISIPNSTTANIQPGASWYSYSGNLTINSHGINAQASTTPSVSIATTNNKLSLFINPVTYRLSSNELNSVSNTGTLMYEGNQNAVFSSSQQYNIEVMDGNAHTESWVIANSMNWHSLMVNFEFE